MSEQITEVQKLAAIAVDLGIPAELRIKAIELLGRLSTNDALRALLDVVASEKLIREERELALRQAGAIIKAGH